MEGEYCPLTDDELNISLESSVVSSKVKEIEFKHVAEELERRQQRKKQDDEEFLNLLRMQEADDDDEEVDEDIPEEPAAATDDIMNAMADQEEEKVQQVSPPKALFDVGFGINVTQQQDDLKRHRSKHPDLANPSQVDLLEMIGGCNMDKL